MVGNPWDTTRFPARPETLAGVFPNKGCSPRRFMPTVHDDITLGRRVRTWDLGGLSVHKVRYDGDRVMSDRKSVV